MGRTAYKYDVKEDYGYQTSALQSNPIVYGHFPQQIKKTSTSSKLNQGLLAIVFALLATTFISYSLVASSERKLNKLGKEIVYYTNENMDLQNRLDNLNSFRHVDMVIKQNTALDTAKKIMEIPATSVAETPKTAYVPNVHNWVIGY